MNSDRRLVLKSLAAAGLAVSGMSWAQSTPTDVVPPGQAAGGGPLLAVTSLAGGAKLNSAFLVGVEAGSAGVRSTLPPLQLQGFDAKSFMRLGSLLEDGVPTLLVGFLDDAAAALVLDLVRSAGGQVLAVQHHRVGVGAAALPWAQALGHSLVTGDAAALASVTAGGDSHACVSFRCVI